MQERGAWTLLYAISFALAFVGYPVLSAGLGALDAYSRVFSIVYRAGLLFGTIALIWLATKKLDGRAWQGPVPIAFCSLWAMLIARFVWDSSFVPIPLPLPWFDYFLMMVGTVLVPTVGLYHVASERSLDIARRIILVGCLLAGVLIVVAVFRIVFESDSIAALRRFGTDELNPISLGNIGVVLVTVALLGQRLPQSGSIVVRLIDSKLFRVPAGALGAFLAIASASKGPIVALLGVFTLAQIAHILRTGSARELFLAAIKLALVLVALIVLALALGVFFNVRVVDRFVDLTVDNSTSDRVAMITRALIQFEGSPWWGSAFVERGARFYPHNLFAEVLMAVGIPGLCALLVILLAALRAGARVLRTRHDWVVLVCAQYQIAIMVTGSLYFSAEFWISMAVVLGVDRLLVRHEPIRSPSAPSSLALTPSVS